MADRRAEPADPFLEKYQSSELKIASEFLTTWLPFLSRDLCSGCVDILTDRIRSLEPEVEGDSELLKSDANLNASTSQNSKLMEQTSDNRVENFDGNSVGSGKDKDDTNSLGSWKDGENGSSELAPEASKEAACEPSSMETPSPRMSWADMAQEDELEEGGGDEDEEEDPESSKRVVNVNVSTGELRISKVIQNPKLPREQREQIRFTNVQRKKDFICLERIHGKLVNIVDGLELHSGIFSAAEQKRIVDYVYMLEEKGRRGELRERTFTAPQKWMRGKGRVTIQFGCCYNYATDRKGNPPGILSNEQVDPLPDLFKVIIRRLVKWHVLPPTCVPDSCIVNIYEEGDCIPPHIDNHDFVRPFCTVSFLTEWKMLFGSNLKVVGPGEFDGPYSIPLPVGSVLVLNGNGADVAKHCVPAVPAKRISITFRRMDESKRPHDYAPEPDLQGIVPLPYDAGEKSTGRHNKVVEHRQRYPNNRRGGQNNRSAGRSELSPHTEPYHSNRGQQRGPANWRRSG